VTFSEKRGLALGKRDRSSSDTDNNEEAILNDDDVTIYTSSGARSMTTKGLGSLRRPSKR